MLKFTAIPGFEDITIVQVDDSDFTLPRNTGERRRRFTTSQSSCHRSLPWLKSAFAPAGTGGGNARAYSQCGDTRPQASKGPLAVLQHS